MQRIKFIIILILFVQSSYAATTADYFNGFEGGTNGNTVTTSTLSAGQKGSGGSYSISKNPMTGYTFSTSGQLTSARGFTVGGTNYDFSGNMGYSASMAQESAAHGYFTYVFPANHDNVAVGFMWKYPNLSADDPWGSYTVACIYSSGGYYNCLGMIGYGSPYAGTKYKAGIEAQGGGDPFVVDADTTYWVTINWVRNGTSVVRFYNSTTFELLGTSSYANVNYAAAMILIGRPDAHPGTSNTNMYFDNLAIKYDSTDPLLPSALDPPQTAFYVDKDSIGGTCNDSNAGTITSPWCTIGKANTSAVAGNTIHIRAGTYTANYINPSNSGTSGSPITFTAYGNETVTISGQDYAVLINGKNYIKVDKINATGCVRNLYIIGGSYNEISNSSFLNPTNTTWDVSIIYNGSQRNWIHHNTFGRGGCCGVDGTCSASAGEDFGTTFAIGVWTNATESSNYNLVENNIMYHGGHNVMGIYSKYNTIRNNYLHNEAFSNSCGNRNIEIGGEVGVAGWNLFEGNRLGYPAKPCDDYVTANVGVSTPYNIFRYNALYHTNANQFSVTAYTGYESGSYNKFYNNTFYNTGYNIDAGYLESQADSVFWWQSSSAASNVVTNNLYSAYYQVSGGSPVAQQIIGTNWAGDTEGNPLFISASTTPPGDKTDSTIPNLSLNVGSPAIDGGVALTTVAAADTGSGTSLVLTNASFFQDGTWAPAGTVSADYIAVGTVTNTTQISSIDYSTNTVTLATAVSRNDGDSVWLYKKSDGTRVLYGTAPDFGAYETTGEAVITSTSVTPGGVIKGGVCR